MQRHAYNLILERNNGGSGLQLSGLMRFYVMEYADRIWSIGPEGFPTSFNIMEAFLDYDEKYAFYDLREEKEHLLSLDDYLEWYTGKSRFEGLGFLSDVMEEGVVYSYDFLSDSEVFRLSGESDQVVAGVSFVRHEYELSCVMIAGENPSFAEIDPIPKDAEVSPYPGKEKLKPHPDYSEKDRFLDGYPEFTKVILMTRFDLRDGTHDVRYINIDEGPSFRVLTDDSVVLGSLRFGDGENLKEELTRYSDLFSCAASMVYLPAYFVSESENVDQLEFQTKNSAKPVGKDLKQMIKALGKENCTFTRRIRCLPATSSESKPGSVKVAPPTLDFQSEGYWKPIGFQEVGEDKSGKKTLGRTWVTRTETWSARSPTEFTVGRLSKRVQGPTPGYIYVQRSPAHGIDIYKVGLTERSVEVRAAELSSATGVPLPFVVLARYEVGDCKVVEREVHKALAEYRVNENREFFHVDIGYICSVIIRVINGDLV